MSGLARANDPATSHAAAASIDTTALEALVLAQVRECGSDGATLDDLVRRTGLDKVTVSPRLKPLETKGFVLREGKRPGSSNRQQTVWKAAA